MQLPKPPWSKLKIVRQDDGRTDRSSKEEKEGMNESKQAMWLHKECPACFVWWLSGSMNCLVIVLSLSCRTRCMLDLVHRLDTKRSEHWPFHWIRPTQSCIGTGSRDLSWRVGHSFWIQNLSFLLCYPDDALVVLEFIVFMYSRLWHSLWYRLSLRRLMKSGNSTLSS